MKGIKITQLPNMLNPNEIIKNEIKRIYGNKCPFCGESRDFLNCLSNGEYKGIDSGVYKAWYGKQYEADRKTFSIKKMFEKSRYWNVDCYSCYTCGCHWDTPAYPRDILDNADLNNILDELIERNST